MSRSLFAQDLGMTKDRLAAFSDGVIAVIITIMVLELKAPHDAGFNALRQELPGFLSYVLSFVYVAIYWNKSPPLSASRRTGRRHRAVGQPAPPVLAVAHTLCDELARRASPGSDPGGLVRRRAVPGGDRLAVAADGDHQGAWPGVGIRPRARYGHQGQGLTGALPHRHRVGLPRCAARRSNVRPRRADLAGAGPARRAGGAAIVKRRPAPRRLALTGAAAAGKVAGEKFALRRKPP